MCEVGIGNKPNIPVNAMNNWPWASLPFYTTLHNGLINVGDMIP